MSSVQFSVSGSGAARESIPQRARRSVCRSLFGSVDHDELNRDIEAKLRELSDRDQKRWNFNFGSGTPLQGAYEWEGAAAEATPAFYQESVQVGKNRAVVVHVKPRTDAPNRQNSAQDPAGGSTGSPGSASAGKPSARLPTAAPRRIPDFYPTRRKQGDLKRSKRAPQNPVSFRSFEQTPRKRLR
ncbi:hypothetical protein AMELA_G00155850 [Ameiurus melas]|uniref:Cyclin-dependent kinase inhibitor domain-containing protein n=1 Tax=Ameiurus melas TaxID=219545 RepID=A0A7J6AHP6_AMEME|nr:hypothetical protein AMELA_G00155850 [Ameiurus melas]